MDPETVSIGEYEYKVSEKLGQGAYGTVFRGRRISDGEQPAGAVALKRVPSGMMKDAEVDSAHKAHSPYVVHCLGVVEVASEDMTYVVMELCDMDLGEFLQKYGGKLTAQNLDTLAHCLAEGYLTLYQNGIVHRDIKPQNIMLKLKPTMIVGDSDDSDNENEDATAKRQPRIEIAKFSDFGCSRDMQSGVDMENLAGTLLYMAPEVGANIVEAHKYTSQIDMWSIGCVLYECIAGDTPFSEQQLCKLFLKAMDGNYFNYKAPVPAEADAKFKSIIGGLLALDPNARLNPKDFRYSVFNDQKENLAVQDVSHKISADRSKEMGLTKSTNNINAKIKRSASALFARLLPHNVKL